MPDDTHPSHAAPPYGNLSPETILRAAERVGLEPTGGFQALNSYENRVYKLETETVPWAIKFYRPNRWSDAAIREEHDFTQALVDDEIPAVAPLRRDGETLFVEGGYRFAIFPWRPGRAGAIETAAERRALGRYLGRLHLAGTGTFTARPTLSVETYADAAIAVLRDSPFLPSDLRAPFLALATRLSERMTRVFAKVNPQILRLHGDCHTSNVLFDGETFSIVDFDDCLNGPAIQDLWMLLPGDRAEQEEALRPLVQGYEMFRPFHTEELQLIEPLRTLRLLHYNSWIARRWHDPAFPRAFPWFQEDRHFRELLALLALQDAQLLMPPIQMSWES